MFIYVIAATRVEDGLYAIIEKMLDMAVHQFRWVADRIAWDGGLPIQIGLTGGRGGDCHLKAQGGEERMPKGKLFHEVQLEGKPDPAPSVLNRFELGKVLLFESIDIEGLGIGDETLRLDDPVTLVPAYQLAFMVKSIDGQQAVIGTSFAMEGFC